MKSKGLFLLLAVMMILATACSSQPTTDTSPKPENPQAAAPKEEVKTFKVAGNMALIDLEHGKLFAKLVEEKSGGKMKAELYLEGQLGTNDEDLSTAVSEGSFDIYPGADMMATWVAPDWAGYPNVPFAYRDAEHAKAVWRSEIGEDINKRMIEKYGVRVLHDSPRVRTPRYVTANKPIKSVEDMKGLKFRTPNIAAVVASWQAAGANVTPVPFGELFGALQTGVVDAQENPVAQIKQTGLFQVQKYLMKTAHQYNVNLTHVNEKFWQSLNEEERNIIIEANKEASEFYNTEIVKEEEGILEEFKNAGMTIIEADEIDIESFKNKIVPAILEQYGKEWAPGGWDKIQSIK